MMRARPQRILLLYGLRMKPFSFYNRIVDVMEELTCFSVITRGYKEMLVDRYLERVESAEELHKRVSLT